MLGAEGGRQKRAVRHLAVGLPYFLVLCPDLQGVEAARAALDLWLADMGLHLSPTKTRISHTQHQVGENVGFDFLGFTIRNYPVGKYHAGSTKSGEKLGFKTFITPSKEAVKRHIATMGTLVEKNSGTTQQVVITDLNRANVG